ncbi:hypothetical protein N7495_001512 [Penicillium taxi]|uniref:uncharacterized protein n=1 Tax=Penicillium taxi TaxID=168475 RepID=UPI002544E40B|nr:uncharacterized protein N7495_001512 [Penicillium taxi]KAJ5908830.1 hypothetical protein N7495_001512 [Penicillium taxi]
MRPSTILILAATAVTATVQAIVQTSTYTTNTLNVTVLTAHNNISTLECWALKSGFKTSTEAGTIGSKSLNLGILDGTNGGNSTYTVLPANYSGGRHNAPTKQWVIFLSGLAHITLPNSTTEAWVSGGRNGAILALDTADTSYLGHISDYPSQEETVSLEIPLGEEGVPPHRVLNQGACQGDQLS